MSRTTIALVVLAGLAVSLYYNVWGLYTWGAGRDSDIASATLVTVLCFALPGILVAASTRAPWPDAPAARPSQEPVSSWPQRAVVIALCLLAALSALLYLFYLVVFAADGRWAAASYFLVLCGATVAWPPYVMAQGPSAG